MESGNSSNTTTNTPNPSRNNGEAPATRSPPPPTAPGSSNQNATPRSSSGLPPTAPSSLTCREQDRYMPIANVVRIMRRALPPHAKISDEAKETVQECVSEFIAFVTEEANERCRKENRKTITGEDLLWAVGRLGFDDYLDPLRTYLKRYRESEAVGLGKIEMASRQRRHANRAAEIQGSSASHQPLAMIAAGVMPNPTLMPPSPIMINPHHQSGIISPLRNPSYFNDGSNPNPSPNAGFISAAAVGGEHGPNPNSNPTPGASFNFRGGSSDDLSSFNMPSPTPSAGSESDMSFFDLLNQFK